MRVLILFIIITVISIFFTTCNLFNNRKVEDKKYTPSDRDYILTNKTPHNNLTLYLSETENDSCQNFIQIAILNRDQIVPIHVSKSKIIWIYYCTQTDRFCEGCRKKELKGETSWDKNIILN